MATMATPNATEAAPDASLPSLSSELVASVAVVAIIEELHSTEEAFVGDLCTMVNTYLGPMRERHVCDEVELRNLFSNGESLLQTHQALLQHLPTVRRLSSVGRNAETRERERNELTRCLKGTVGAFIALEPFLLNHAEFASNYEHVALETHRVLAQQPGFARFCHEAEQAGALSLQALLVRPIERLCTYPRLFERLKKAAVAAQLGGLSQNDETLDELRVDPISSEESSLEEADTLIRNLAMRVRAAAPTATTRTGGGGGDALIDLMSRADEADRTRLWGPDVRAPHVGASPIGSDSQSVVDMRVAAAVARAREGNKRRTSGEPPIPAAARGSAPKRRLSTPASLAAAALALRPRIVGWRLPSPVNLLSRRSSRGAPSSVPSTPPRRALDPGSPTSSHVADERSVGDEREKLERLQLDLTRSPPATDTDTALAFATPPPPKPLDPTAKLLLSASRRLAAQMEVAAPKDDEATATAAKSPPPRASSRAPSRGGATLPESMGAAAAHGDVAAVMAWLDDGGDVDATMDEAGGALRDASMLLRASACGHVALVAALLQRAADVELSNSRGGTPLMLASLHGHLPVVEVLLSRGALVDRFDAKGYAAVHLAELGGHAEVARRLQCVGPPPAESPLRRLEAVYARRTGTADAAVPGAPSASPSPPSPGSAKRIATAKVIALPAAHPVDDGKRAPRVIKVVSISPARLAPVPAPAASPVGDGKRAPRVIEGVNISPAKPPAAAPAPPPRRAPAADPLTAMLETQEAEMASATEVVVRAMPTATEGQEEVVRAMPMRITAATIESDSDSDDDNDDDDQLVQAAQAALLSAWSSCSSRDRKLPQPVEILDPAAIAREAILFAQILEPPQSPKLFPSLKPIFESDDNDDNEEPHMRLTKMSATAAARPALRVPGASPAASPVGDGKRAPRVIEGVNISPAKPPPPPSAVDADWEYYSHVSRPVELSDPIAVAREALAFDEVEPPQSPKLVPSLKPILEDEEELLTRPMSPIAESSADFWDQSGGGSEQGSKEPLTPPHTDPAPPPSTPSPLEPPHTDPAPPPSTPPLSLRNLPSTRDQEPPPTDPRMNPSACFALSPAPPPPPRHRHDMAEQLMVLTQAPAQAQALAPALVIEETGAPAARAAPPLSALQVVDDEAQVPTKLSPEPEPMLDTAPEPDAIAAASADLEVVSKKEAAAKREKAEALAAAAAAELEAAKVEPSAKAAAALEAAKAEALAKAETLASACAALEPTLGTALVLAREGPPESPAGQAAERLSVQPSEQPAERSWLTPEAQTVVPDAPSWLKRVVMMPASPSVFAGVPPSPDGRGGFRPSDGFRVAVRRDFARGGGVPAEGSEASTAATLGAAAAAEHAAATLAAQNEAPAAAPPRPRRASSVLLEAPAVARAADMAAQQPIGSRRASFPPPPRPVSPQRPPRRLTFGMTSSSPPPPGETEGTPKTELANGQLQTPAYSFPSPPSAPPSAQPARESPNKLPSPAVAVSIAVTSAVTSAVSSAKSPLESFLEHYKLDRMVMCLGPGQQEALLRQPTFADGQRNGAADFAADFAVDGAVDGAANGATKTDEWLGGQSDWLRHKGMATLPSPLSKTSAARTQSPTNSHRSRNGSVSPDTPIRAASLILQREPTALRGSDLYGTVRQRLRRVESFPAPPKTSSE